ncbi:MAG: ABC transporter ATP-binding protein [Planctomycetia bacterium]|nr:ABC transporter ATP-binding protein [Planctomycetia bacterium]
MTHVFPLLAVRGLHKAYRQHQLTVPVLHGVDLDVYNGDFLCILGASGSGKSTLLHLMGTLDQPDQGSVLLDGERIDNAPGPRRDKLRNATFGFIFQFYHLLPELTALENVLVPPMIEASILGWFWQGSAYRKRATELLERVGLGHRLHHKPRELSGGEMQRVAIARALMGQPRVLFADEPTGNLDEEKGEEIVGLLRDLNRRDALTMIMVTHNRDLVAPTDRVVRLVKGRVEGASTPPAEQPTVLEMPRRMAL